MPPLLGDSLLAGRVLLAHGGGAPEALTIAVPLVVVVGFVLAELRVRRRDRERDAGPDRAPNPELPDDRTDPPAT